jgi:hypothetical protein
MPKILIAQSQKNKRDRFIAATSAMNMKKEIEERIAEDATDTDYQVITLNTKMKLKVVCSLMNASFKRIRKMDGVVGVEEYKLDPEKKKGRWTIDALKDGDEPKKEKKTSESDGDEGKKSKKEKKNKKAKKDRE